MIRIYRLLWAVNSSGDQYSYNPDKSGGVKQNVALSVRFIHVIQIFLLVFFHNESTVLDGGLSDGLSGMKNCPNVYTR